MTDCRHQSASGSVMRLSDIGEEAFIERIVREHMLPTTGAGLVVGVGDDAAVLDLGQSDYMIVTTDMMIEKEHFRTDIITPYQLGWKSVAVNISDIAAMGGVPSWTFISIGLRGDTSISFADEMYRGMTECAGRFGSTLAGGDTNAVKGECVVSVTQMGWVEPDCVVTRSGARVGDRILVTGWLGNSRGGLELLLRYGLEEAARMFSPLVGAHLTPMPRVSESRAAVQATRVQAMMDLSDGLGADLRKLCKASGVGAVVHADSLPISDDLKGAARELGMDAIELAAGGGEDFELLMVVAPEDVARIRDAVISETGTMVTEIGEIVEGGVDIEYPNGDRKPLTGGWEHFKSA